MFDLVGNVEDDDAKYIVLGKYAKLNKCSGAYSVCAILTVRLNFPLKCKKRLIFGEGVG